MTPQWRVRLKLAAATVLTACAISLPAWHATQAQTPPPVEPLVIVNDDEEKPFVERKKQGEFRARPIFSQRLSKLTYGIRDADTGEWLTSIYRINGGEDERDEGWGVRLRLPGGGRATRSRSRTHLPLGPRGTGRWPCRTDHVLHHDP